jgi:hypothetical protein
MRISDLNHCEALTENRDVVGGDFSYDFFFAYNSKVAQKNFNYTFQFAVGYEVPNLNISYQYNEIN